MALPEFVIQAYTDQDDIVYEPFGGSGTTLLACQRTGRQGRAVEIAPEYVDVAIQRFQQNFPGIPVSLMDTGEAFAEVAAARQFSSDSDLAENQRDRVSLDRHSDAPG